MEDTLNLERRASKSSDEWEESSLHLVEIERNGEKTRYTFRWVVRAYEQLATGVIYNSHYIRIGKQVHRFRILRHVTKIRNAVGRRTIHVLLGLTPKSYRAQIQLSILSADFEIFPLEVGNQVLHIPNRNCYEEFVETFSIFQDFNELLVECNIKIDDSSIPVEIVRDNTVATDFECLYKSKLLTDMKIEVNGKEFLAHRAVLCARSVVLQAMFLNNMLENSENKLVITDADPEAFEEFLHYLYSGKMEPLTVDIALSLLSLADKYDVPHLKAEITDFLACNLSITHAMHILVAADLHNEPGLKKDAVMFIGDHLWSTMKQPNWSEFRKNLKLVDAILGYLA